MKFMSKHENPERPLLRLNIWFLETWGLWQPRRTFRNYIHNFVMVFMTIYITTEYIELWIIRSNNESALRNLSYTLLGTTCWIKAVTLIVWQEYWMEIIDYVTDLEKSQRSQKDQEIDNIIDDYNKYSRKITYSYCVLILVTVLGAMLAPIVFVFVSTEITEGMRNGSIPYPEIMSSWVPFDKTRGIGYYVLAIIQICGNIWGGGVFAGYDTTMVTLMSFFAGQLRVLKVNCERIFGDINEQISSAESMKRIKARHDHHLNILRLCKLLNSMLSPVMFFYVIVCSLMICASTVTWTGGRTSIEKFRIAEYVLALIFQLFLYCWHSTEVFYASNDVSYAVFSSLWWSKNHHARRDMHLLCGQFHKTVVFYAGPFTKLDVATFINILQGSYSYYTLLK